MCRLLVFVIILPPIVFIACESRSSVSMESATQPETLAVDGPVIPTAYRPKAPVQAYPFLHPCLDGNQLKRWGIRYDTLVGKSGTVWRLSYSEKDTGVVKPPVDSLLYYYSFSAEKVCEQKDSLFPMPLDSLALCIGDQHYAVDSPEVYPAYSYEDLTQTQITLRDYNFDGFMDFRLYYRYWSGAANPVFGFFLFDEEKDRFQYAGMLDNPFFYPEERAVVTVFSSGNAGATGVEGSYRLSQDDIFIPLRLWHCTELLESKQPQFKTTITVYDDTGELITKRDTIHEDPFLDGERWARPHTLLRGDCYPDGN